MQWSYEWIMGVDWMACGRIGLPGWETDVDQAWFEYVDYVSNPDYDVSTWCEWSTWSWS